jgi:hypothetical protein
VDQQIPGQDPVADEISLIEVNMQSLKSGLVKLTHSFYRWAKIYSEDKDKLSLEQKAMLILKMKEVERYLSGSNSALNIANLDLDSLIINYLQDSFNQTLHTKQEEMDSNV